MIENSVILFVFEFMLSFMNKINVMTKRQFDAFCYCRAPYLDYLSIEVDWFSAFNKKVLGVVVLDYMDQDFGYIILGRSTQRVFRCIEPCNKFYKTKQEATKALFDAFAKYENDEKEFYEQGDEKNLIHDILKPCVPVEKYHKYFKLITEESGYKSAKKLMQEIAYSYVDVDGNYIKDFQTTGFDARLWELYLYIYLHSAGCSISNEFQAPDYNISYFGDECCIEAVTVNPNPKFDERPPNGPKETFKYIRDYMPIKFGSPLFSKLQKKYWEKPHVRGKPFIIAIHDYHMEATPDNLGSMVWSRGALMDYLYGQRLKQYEDKNGEMKIEYEEDGVTPVFEEIDKHEWKGKMIPSNFFEQPDSENVSAVLFSNNATITAFNRMGQLAGISEEKNTMIRQCILPNPNSPEPIVKGYNIDSDEYEEAWSDGLIMYHNPNAKHPVSNEMFGDISHIYFDKKRKRILADITKTHVIASQTIVFKKKN